MARLTREEVLKKLKNGEKYDNIIGFCDDIETVTPFLNDEHHCKFAFLFLNHASIYVNHSNGYEERRHLSDEDVIKAISELKESELNNVYWRMYKTKSITIGGDVKNCDMEFVKKLKEELKNKTIEEITDITYEVLNNNYNYRIDNFKMVLFYRLSDFVKVNYNVKEDWCKSYKKLYKNLSLKYYEIEFMNKLIKIFGNDYDNHEIYNLKIKDNNEDLQFTIRDLLEFKFVIDNYNNIRK